MNYWSLNEESIKDSKTIQDCLAVVEKHKDFFNDKNLFDFIRVAWFANHRTGEEAKPAQVLSTISFRIVIRRDKRIPQVLLDDLTSLSSSPEIVDAF